MSLRTSIGAIGNLLDERPDDCRRVAVPRPVLDRRAARASCGRSRDFQVANVADALRPAAEGPDGLGARGRRALPSRLAGGLGRRRDRDPVRPRRRREHARDPGAAGHGRRALAPRARGGARHVRPGGRVGRAARDDALRPAARLRGGRREPLPGAGGRSDAAAGGDATSSAVGKGLLKICSKMGISTIQSYRGAQIFEAVGLGPRLVDRYFPGTVSRVGGIELDDVHAAGRSAATSRAFGDRPRASSTAASTGCAPGGERHAWDPGRRSSALQRAVRDDRRGQLPRRTPRRVDAAGRTARCAGCSSPAGRRRRCRSAQVEPSAEIVRRFATGAMSLGSIVAGGARDAGDRHEPARRSLEHRRGRRGSRPLGARRQRRPAALGDQAGGVGPVRRDGGLPGRRRPAADQDRAGREARRGRPAARATRSTS